MAKEKNEKSNSNEKIVLVEFRRSHTPYVKGEVAGFKEGFANKLIEKDIAIIFKK